MSLNRGFFSRCEQLCANAFGLRHHALVHEEVNQAAQQDDNSKQMRKN